MATVTNPPVIISALYNADSPGPICQSHRSVYCPCVQSLILNREDADLLAEVLGNKVGQEFSISFPIYPQFCIWEKLNYTVVNHESLGFMAELIGKIATRHRVVHRLLLGESASDLAESLRDYFETEVEDYILELRTTKRQPGLSRLPRCRNNLHGMRYQRLLNEMTEPKLLNDEWDSLRDQTHAMMWTWHYHQQCLFCWTKTNMADAIRVSPDFAVDAAEPQNNDDLIPDASDTKRSSSTPPW